MNIKQEEPSSSVISHINSSDDGTTKTKRKKTSRACNHCHKTHMTCDSGRPCKRCIQKGLQSTCEDAPRKRKKYLADVPNSSLLTSRSINSTNLSFVSSAQPPELLMSIQEQQNVQAPPVHVPAQHRQSLLPVGAASHVGPQNSIQSDSIPTTTIQQSQAVNYSPNHKTYQATMFQHSSTAPNLMHSVSEYFPELYNQQFQPPEHPNQKRRTNFLSSAADLEYATLSNILHETFGHHSTSNEGTPNSHNFSPALSPHNMPTTNGTPSASASATTTQPHPLIQLLHLQTDGLSSTAPTTNSSIEGSTDQLKVEHPYNNKSIRHDTPSPLNATRAHVFEDTKYPKCDETINQYYLGETESGHVVVFPDVLTAIMNMKNNDPAVYIERNSKLELSFTIGVPHEDHTKGHREDTLYKEPEEIYAQVNKPFSYTPGYHSLIAYLRKRFDKPMLVKMAESMAIYRPSFIACTNSLKEHDLIFMEQCFQRTLLTYDNIIRLSGTPTIVWRRTGEIAYVGNEFCILTGWTREELVGKGMRRFIVELLDDKSVLEYFQLFSKIAFGDFLGATMTECTLLTPNPEVKIRTGCMWTLKRDVFGIPMMIVGNFLPII